MTLLAVSCLLAAAGSASGQSQLTLGGFVGAGGPTGAAAGHQAIGYATAGPVGTSASAGHIVQGGLLFGQVAGVIFLAQLNVGPAMEGAPLPVTVEAMASMDASLELYFRPGGSDASFTGPLVMTAGAANTYTGSIPLNAVGVRGLEIFVRGVQDGVTTSLASATDPYRVRTAMNNHRSPVLPDAAFRMIGFPFDVDPATVAAVFQDDLGAPDATQWKLGRWDEPTADYLEYEDVGNVLRGRGYWLAVRHDKRFGASGLSALPTEIIGIDEYARIDLAPGWNQISTPFAFAIAWADRVESDDPSIADALYAYVGGQAQYALATVLEPYEGYWVENTSATDQVLYLPYEEFVFPQPAAEAPRDAPAAAAADDWRLQLALVAGDLRDDLLAVGVRPTARDDRDSGDYGKPPRAAGSYLSLSSLMTDDLGGWQALAGDFRAPGAEGWRFALRAEGNVSETAYLQVADATSLPSSFAMALYVPTTGAKYAITPGEDLVLPLGIGPEGTTYQLLVGQRTWVEDHEGEDNVIPERFALRQNYPNPFNPQTTIQFELPTPRTIKLDIFDARGRHVTTLRHESMAAGIHRVVWTGVDDAGASVASGLYFYRIAGGDAADTRRMLMLK